MGKCITCQRPFTQGMKPIDCCVCFERFHVRCSGLGYTDCNRYKTSNDWICKLCTADIFPFNHMEDENLFRMCVNEASLPSIIDFEKLSTLKFNPFLLSKYDTILDDPDLDPDVNFLNNITNMSNKYYIEEQLNSEIQDKKLNNNIKLFHANIRSYFNNEPNLRQLICNITTDIHMISLTETWTSRLNESDVQLDGFNSIVKSRQNCKGGGVALLVRNDFKVTTNNEVDHYLFEEFEYLVVNVSLPNKDIIVATIYRPPGRDISKFMIEFSNFLVFLCKSKKTCYLCGDFNINLLNYDDHVPTQSFLDTLFSSSFRPLINMPTRITNLTSTLIDNIFTNDLCNSYFTGIMYSDVSDHLPVFTVFPTDVVCDNKKAVYVQKRKITEDSKELFISEMKNETWEDTLDNNDPNSSYDAFINKIRHVYDRHFPKINKRIKFVSNKSKPWVTPSLITCSKRKNKLYKQSLLLKTDESIIKYKAYKNKLTHILRIAEKQHYLEKFENAKNNLGKTWKIIKALVNKGNKQDLPSEFKIGNNMTNDPQKISGAFNNFFANVGTGLAKKIVQPTNVDFSKFLKDSKSHSMFFLPTDEDEIKDIILSIKSNTSSGHDELSPSIIVDSINSFLKPLVHIINCSLSSGVVPDNMKIARITPVYKNDDKHELNNYRPISILPYFSKILEKIVYKRTMDFINKHNILYNNQYGFRQKHSTFMALLETVDQISEALDNKETTVGVFVDLSKAFDTVDHTILLRKLCHYGIRGIVLDWFSSYISNRLQYVSINNSKSKMLPISCGVPQGSILGPLLFLIYVNDMVNCSALLKFILFADDTNIFYSTKNHGFTENIINDELNKLSIWFRVNKLSLNIKKTNFIVFGKLPQNSLELKIENERIERVKTAKFLGVVIDEKLKWREHITVVANKVSKSLGVLNRIKHIVPLSILPMIYSTLILPYYQYCNIIWASTCPSYLQKLFLLQKRAMRIISAASYRAHTSELFRKHKQLKVFDLNKMQTAIFMFKYRNNLLSQRFSDYFKTNAEVHHYATRSKSLFHVIRHNSKTRSFCIKIQGPLLWNSLEEALHQCRTIFSFKRQYKAHLLSKY
jgi:exonuclease III